MFKVIIVEDEKPILDLMKYVIGHNQNYNIIGAFTNPLEALACLPLLKPDVVFLDVEMPRMNGLELAQKIVELSEEIRIIFTTAYRQYALDAFEVFAFDYILKPVTPAAIERVASRLIKKQKPALPAEQEDQRASIHCFGGFEVRNREGVTIRFPTRKSEELFAFFLCHPGKELSKWHLVDLLWPQMQEDRSSHNLHNTIYRLKKILKEHRIGIDIQNTNEGYRMEVSDFMYDVLAFDRQRSALNGVLQDHAHMDWLCSLYKGPLLDRKDYVWKTSLEEGYVKQYTLLVRTLIESDMVAQEWTKAELRLDAYLSLYPLHEEMNQLLMDIFTRSGNTEKIAKHYERFAASYRREIGLEPSQEMRDRMTTYIL
ncbi:response regulator [Paenibacillus periandrae]|uniref:response regulator n=1 Tax=Paenibacillus periandrae TaxID=1761741 RepID=UPI001F08DB60|nr:response regulator [Paenibacillus periandrae]